MEANEVIVEAGQIWRHCGGALYAIIEVRDTEVLIEKQGVGTRHIIGLRGLGAYYRPEAEKATRTDEPSAGLHAELIAAMEASPPMSFAAPVFPAVETAEVRFREALADECHPYHRLAATLLRAFEQAANGKGKERHASGDTPFENQPMATINMQLGSIDGFIYQAHKKSLEAKRLPDGRAQAELLGAINYLAGSVIALDSWAKKGTDK